MKKIKLMLLSLALFAVVGAALAFKARFNNTWCITTPTVGTCPATLTCGDFYVTNASTTVNAGVVSCTTTTNFLDPLTQDICTDAVGVTKKCVFTKTITSDGIGATQLIHR